MIQLLEKDQELIDELKEHSHYEAITYCGDEVPKLLDIISRYQKALEKAVEQRDSWIGKHSWASSNIESANEKLQNILNGGEG